jgi:hypothetical protein
VVSALTGVRLLRSRQPELAMERDGG